MRKQNSLWFIPLDLNQDITLPVSANCIDSIISEHEDQDLTVFNN